MIARPRLLLPALSTLAAALALTGAPPEARACGGTFCDAGPQAMPVDQTGENILFVIDGQHVEAHIQIQYDPDTDADQFAWVIPLQALPQFSVGSEPLFQNLLTGSVPSYLLNTQNEFCGSSTDVTSDGSGDFTSEGSYDPSTGTDGTGGPDVILQETVGAFDIVVLQGEDTAGLMQWLGDNGYQQDPDAAPIFDDYLKEGYLFAAFKLTTGVGVDQIHPVVLEFDTGEACVPLRLTRIAAQEDMEVRAFFLGNNRVVPRNYRHVIINPLKIDWLNLSNVAANYREVITLAVDALKSDGHGFVTEYAGQSSVVSQGGLFSASWSAAPLVGAEPITVVDTLSQQGIMGCFGDFCEFYHPLVEGLLGEFLPVPDGLDAGAFYSCLECYEGLIDQNAWDAQLFADAYKARIIDPGQRAVDLLNTWPYLTRMYTTISPGEMTVDPFFHENAQLGDVSATRTGTRTNLCSGDSVVELPDGRQVFIPDGLSWPAFIDELPYEEDIEETMQVGAPVNLVDNTPIIDAALDKWNSDHGWPQGPGGTDTTAGTDSGTDSGGTASGSGSGGTDSGGTDSGGTDSGSTDSGGESGGSGCSCRSSDRSSEALGVGLLALAFGLGLRRRR
ncbi:MAG: DUF2330 domain-containing protein [Nannocystaceae bacterium]